MQHFQLLTEQEVSDLLRIPLQTLRNHRSLGCGLPYLKLGRSVRYSLADVDEYLSAHKISTAEPTKDGRAPWEKK
jgi:excisionase family DNA binding protein